MAKLLDMAGKKPYIAMVILQLILAGKAMFSKAAFNIGMKPSIFVFYRQAVATIFLAPLAIIFGRRNAPPLPFKTLVKIFMLALLGFTINLNVYSLATKYTSATVASATTNMLPAITFCLALVLRIEGIRLKNTSGMAKIFGISLCLAGAMLIVFYKGPCLKSFNSNHASLSTNHNKEHVNTSSNMTWVKGSFLMIVATVIWSLWIILQGFILVEYPSKLLFTTLCCFFSTFQSFAVAIAMERKISSWKVHCNEGFLAIAYNGVFVAGAAAYLQAWCIVKKGPVFAAMFTPLAFVITIPCSSLLLGENIELGSVLGGVLMVGGLYSTLWGKSREKKESIVDVEDGS